MEWHWWGVWYPWAEENQGLLSVVALFLALGFGLWEQARANREARAARIAQYEADTAASRAAEAARIKAIDEYGAIVELTLVQIKIDIATEARRAELQIAQSSVWECPTEFEAACKGAGQSLLGLIQSSPRDPNIIVATQKAAELLRGFVERPVAWAPALAMQNLEKLLKAVTLRQGEIELRIGELKRPNIDALA